jgi:hypothetical protein
VRTGVVLPDRHGNVSNPKPLFSGANRAANPDQVAAPVCSLGIKLLLVQSPHQGIEQNPNAKQDK